MLPLIFISAIIYILFCIYYLISLPAIANAEILILQLNNNISFESFESKYNQFINDKNTISDLNVNNRKSQSNLKKIQIGKIKLVIADFNINFQKSVYFDKSVVSISLNLDLTICETNPTSLVQYFSPKHLVQLNQLNSIKRHQLLNFKFNLFNPINVYILDTGIDSTHPDFTNRVQLKYQLTNDINGHGTSIASVVGSELFGVCKNCNLLSYQILNSFGIGKLDLLIDALYSIYHEPSKGIILLPFITEKSKIINNILNEFKISNFTIVAPAGNYNDDACNYSPSSSSAVLTVGSIDVHTDTIANFSNYGPCVDVFTDGINIQTISNYNSANSLFEKNNITKEDVINLKSGTSLSAAITAGLLASFSGNEKGCNSNLDAIQKLKNLAIQNKIKPAKFLKSTKTPNLIIYNDIMI